MSCKVSSGVALRRKLGEFDIVGLGDVHGTPAKLAIGYDISDVESTSAISGRLAPRTLCLSPKRTFLRLLSSAGHDKVHAFQCTSDSCPLSLCPM